MHANGKYRGLLLGADGQPLNGKPLTVEDFIKPRRSQGYKVPTVLGWASRAVDDRPIFNWLQADRMRRDPQVDFGLRIVRTPIYGATWDIKCKRTEVSEFVHRTLMRFWQRCLRKMFRFYEYGISVGEVSHKLEGGRVQLDRLDDFHPQHTRPLEFLSGRRRGELAGIRLHNVEGEGYANILPPHALWFPGEAEYGSRYGRPRLAGAFEPWLEKRGRNGATDSRRLWYKKCAFRGGVMRHPAGSTDVGDETTGPILRSNQDIAREICEKFENGGILAMLNATDEHGNFLWTYDPPASHPDVAGLREYPKDLDREILIGLGIPPELVEAATVGSGYSGRAIPAQVFFTSMDEIVALILECVDQQIIRPLVRLNFGPVPYHILPKSLAAMVAKEPGGSGQPKGGDGADLMGRQQKHEDGPSLELSDAVNVPEALANRVKALAAQEYPDLEPIELSGARAPKGGVAVQGKQYKGGEFIPGEVMEKATAEEKAAVEGKDKDGQSGPQTPKHGDRAAALHAKMQEVRQARIEAFNAVKADAEAAKDKADEHWAQIGDHVDNTPWIAGETPEEPEEPDDHESPEYAAWQAKHDNWEATVAHTDVMRELESLKDTDHDTPAEQFQGFKDVEEKAKEALTASKAVKPGEGAGQLSAEELADCAKYLKATIAACKSGREHLRVYAKHRQELKAIRDGVALELSFGVEGSAELLQALDLSFDESKINRDHGKFSSKPGASGEGDGGNDKSKDTDSGKGKFRKLLSRISEVPGNVRKKAVGFVVNRYKGLEEKYGRKGAIAILTGMVLLSPTPIPGSSLIPIALAKAVQKVRRRFTDQEPEGVSLSDTGGPDAESLAKAMLETLGQFYAEMGEQPPKITDKDALKVAKQLLEGSINLSDADKPSNHDIDVRRAIYDAMLQAAARVQSGDEEAQDELDALADLAADHSESLDLSWVEHGTSRTGKPRWKNTETGKIRYQQSKPGEKREKREGSEKRARDLSEEIQLHLLHPEDYPAPTPEKWQDLADNLPALSVDVLRTVRNRLLLSAPDAKRHAQLVEAIKAHIASGPKAIEKEEPKPANATATGGSVPKNPTPGKVYNVATNELHVDPERFQFKLNVKGPEGVGEELKGVSKYNPDFGGTLAVWKDPEDGKSYVINGHHRHELASRTGHPTLAVRYIDAPNATVARGKGALINIAEGRGTAVDAAKFMRDTGTTPDDFTEQGISLKGQVARDAAVLMNLSDPLFSRVSRGSLEIDRALAIAAHLPDKDRQTELLSHIEREEERTGKEYSSKIVAEAAQEMAATPTIQEAEQTLFGEEVNDKSVFMQRSELKAHVRSELAKELRDFQAVSSQRRADAVAGAGNVLNIDANREKVKQAENRVDTFTRLASYKGELSDLLNEQAEKYARATSNRERDGIRKETVDRIRTALSEIEQRGLPAVGNGGEGAH